jgi:hypothetical protein
MVVMRDWALEQELDAVSLGPAVPEELQPAMLAALRGLKAAAARPRPPKRPLKGPAPLPKPKGRQLSTAEKQRVYSEYLRLRDERLAQLPGEVAALARLNTRPAPGRVTERCGW